MTTENEAVEQTSPGNDVLIIDELAPKEEHPTETPDDKNAPEQGDSGNQPGDASDSDGGGAEKPTEETVDESLEKLAREWGWVDKDEFAGDEKDWVDAASFIRQERNINDKLRNHNKSMAKKMDEMSRDFKRVMKAQKDKSDQEITRLRKELEEQKSEAIRNADEDSVREIDKKIDELDTLPADDDEPPEGADNPVFDAWKEANPWYGEDEKLTTQADLIAKKYSTKGMTIDEYETLLSIIDTLMEPFLDTTGTDDNPGKTTHRKKAADVAASKRHSKPRTTQKRTINDLPEEERAVVRRFVESGAVESEQAYIDQMFAE